MTTVAKIFAGGLPKDYNQSQFENYFKKFGLLLEAKLILRNGISRGFGFVKYVDSFVADKVVGQIHRIEGQLITVKYSTPERRNANQTKRFYIGGVDDSVITKQILSKYFSEWGIVEDAFVAKGRGYGFVTIYFNNSNKADMLQRLRRHTINHVDVDVKEALPKKNESESGFRPEHRFDAGFKAPNTAPKLQKNFASPYCKEWQPREQSFPSYSADRPSPYEPTPLVQKSIPQNVSQQIISVIEKPLAPKKKRPQYRSVGKYESFGATPAEAFYQDAELIKKPSKPQQASPKPPKSSEFCYKIVKPNQQISSFSQTYEKENIAFPDASRSIGNGMYSYASQFDYSAAKVTTFAPY